MCVVIDQSLRFTEPSEIVTVWIGISISSSFSTFVLACLIFATAVGPRSRLRPHRRRPRSQRTQAALNCSNPSHSNFVSGARRSGFASRVASVVHTFCQGLHSEMSSKLLVSSGTTKTCCGPSLGALRSTLLVGDGFEELLPCASCVARLWPQQCGIHLIFARFRLFGVTDGHERMLALCCFFGVPIPSVPRLEVSSSLRDFA